MSHGPADLLDQSLRSTSVASEPARVAEPFPTPLQRQDSDIAIVSPLEDLSRSRKVSGPSLMISNLAVMASPFPVTFAPRHVEWSARTVTPQGDSPAPRHVAHSQSTVGSHVNRWFSVQQKLRESP